ncbi:MAG: hypothetical protein WCH98_03810 [Verrucomicrobiota bacterium]
MLAEGILFDEVEGDNIEVVGEREVIQFGDDLGTQGIHSPQREIDVRAGRVGALGAGSEKFNSG